MFTSGYTNRINRLQEHVSQNVKGVVSPGLDTSVPGVVIRGSKGQILGLNNKLRVSDGNLEFREAGQIRAHREDVALLLVVVLGAGNSLVQGIANVVRNQGQGGASVGDGAVAGLRDGLAVDGAAGRGEHPEALRVVDVSPGNLLSRGCDEILVDVAECVKGLGVGIPLAVESSSEERRLAGNVVLSNHVGNGSVGGRGLAVGRDGVDGGPGEAEKTITGALSKLLSKG